MSRLSQLSQGASPEIRLATVSQHHQAGTGISDKCDISSVAGLQRVQIVANVACACTSK